MSLDQMKSINRDSPSVKAEQIKFPASVSHESLFERLKRGIADPVRDVVKDYAIDPLTSLTTGTKDYLSDTFVGGAVDAVDDNLINPLAQSMRRATTDEKPDLRYTDARSGLDKSDPRVVEREADEFAGRELWQDTKDFASNTGNKIQEQFSENPEALLEIGLGLENMALAPSRNKLNAANVLAANFGLQGVAKIDEGPSGLERVGRNMISQDIKKQNKQKQKAEKQLSDKYEKLLAAQAGYFGRKNGNT